MSMMAKERDEKSEAEEVIRIWSTRRFCGNGKTANRPVLLDQVMIDGIGIGMIGRKKTTECIVALSDGLQLPTMRKAGKRHLYMYT